MVKGFVFLVLSIIGLLFPIIPQVPFFLVAMAYFSKGNEKFHNWLISCRIYKFMEKIMKKDIQSENKNYMAVK